jgi:hypothetical protein
MPNYAEYIKWDEAGKRFYETGTKKGVLYPNDDTGAYGTGVPWNGLTGVTESPSGAEETPLYADDQKYLSLYSAEEFGYTIEAYTYPDEWEECDGSAEVAPGVAAGQQARKGFGFSYVTTLGNDKKGETYGYKLHLIYGSKASPSEKGYESINDSPNAVQFSWEVKTTPEPIDLPNTSYKPTSCIVIDSTKADATKLAALEAILYGVAAHEEDGQQVEAVLPRLPLPAEVIQLMAA